MAPQKVFHTRALMVLRLAIGFVYLWFGSLKLFPGQSPVEPLMRSAYDFLAQWDIMPLRVFIVIIGVWEMLIGLGFLVGRYMNIMVVLILLQLAGAFSPIVLAPEEVWKSFPFFLTLSGQYIVKDLVLLGAVFVLWSTSGERAEN